MNITQLFHCAFFAGALFIAATPHSATAQGMAVNTTGAPANSSAMLDVSSNTQGILVPRMLSGQRTAISNPATGLMVYQTDAPDGFYYNKGTPASPSWALISTGGTSGSNLGQTFFLNFVAQNNTSQYTSGLSGTILGIQDYKAVGVVFPVAATFDALYVNLFTTAAGATDATTVTLYKNGVATDLTVTLNASGTANTLVSDVSTATVSVNPGDILNIMSSHSVVQNNFRFNITTHCH